MLGVSPTRLTYTAIGMNHLTWFTKVTVDGVCMMPRLHEISAEQLAGFTADGSGSGEPESQSPFSWQLFKTFNAFPAVLDRHVTEFFPQFFADGRYFGKTLGVDAYSFEGCVAYGDERYAEMRQDAFSSAPLGEEYFQRLDGEHEQVLDIIESIRRADKCVYSVNLPNTGQVPNFPADAILECPAIAEASGMCALPLPPVPAGIVGTLATRLAWVETVVDAALEGSRDKFIQA
jgi:alpha-galactosidase